MLSLVKTNYKFSTLLNPILPGGGHYGPPDHISIGCYRAVRGRFTKFHDFVPFGICQDPVKLLLTFFTKKFEKLDVETFWGSLSIRWKWEKIKKKIFLMKLKIWNPYGLRISHIKFEWNRRPKKIFFSKGGTLWYFSDFQKIIKGPFESEKNFVSDSTQILCVKSLGHKDCMFWI